MSSGEMPTIQPMLSLIFPHLESDCVEKEALDPDAAWHFFSHSIIRNPNNLQLHTHRIFFAMKHKDASYLPGSLHDLFYVLKDAGEKLRIRLLKAAAPYLSKKDIIYFAMWIKAGIKNGMGYKWVKGSVLSDGLYAPDQLLIELQASNEALKELTPLEEARSCMEYGQLDVAQKILEDALAENSDDEAIKDELAYLTKCTKSTEAQPESKTSKSKNKIGRTLGKFKKKLFS